MFNVNFYTPEKTVSWLVKQFETLYYAGDIFMEDKFVPRHDASLVFHFKSKPFITTPLNAELPQFFVAPLVNRANTIRISGELNTFIVTCNPSVLSSVFNINMSPTSELSIRISNTVFFPLWQKLFFCSTTRKRINCFNRFLAHFHPQPYQNDLIDITYNNIVKYCITEPLPEILKETPKSVSVIQRNFIKRVGISPKTLTRIVRVNYLFDRINREKVVDFQDLVFDGNYYDQSHFINDFKAITGETPGYFFRRNLKFSNALSGKNY